MDSPNFDVTDTSLAWIGRHTGVPRSLLATVTSFEDSDDFLLADKAFDFGFFIVEYTAANLIELNGFKQCTKITFTKALVTFTLNDFKKYGS